MFRKVCSAALAAAIAAISLLPAAAAGTRAGEVRVRTVARFSVPSGGRLVVFLPGRAVGLILDGSGRFTTMLPSGEYDAALAYGQHHCRLKLVVSASNIERSTCVMHSVRVAAAAPAESDQNVEVAGRTLRLALISRNGHENVSLDRLATLADMHVIVRGQVREFAGPDGLIMRVRPYDSSITAGGRDVYHLSATPFLMAGELYVSIDDADDLLALYPSAQVSANDADAFSTRHVVDAVRVERRNSAGTVVQPSNASRPDASQFSLRYVALDQGPRTHQIELQGNGRTFHGQIGAYGESTIADATYGLVSIGSGGRDIALGSVGDPLAGAVFSAQPVVGVRVDTRTGGTTIFDVDRIESGREVGISMQRGTATQTIALDPNDVLRSVAGIRRVQTGADGTSAEEMWLSPTGLAVGFSRTSAGRAFVDSDSAVALGTMPFTQGDAANRIGIGYHLSPAFTVRGGYGAGTGLTPSAYVNATLASSVASLSVIRSRDEAGASLYARGRDEYASVAYDYSQQGREWQVDSGWHLPFGDLTLAGYSTASSDMLVKLAVPGRFAPVFGYEVSRSTTQTARGALLGIATAAGRNVDLEVDSHPNYAGRALRVAITQRFTVASRAAKTNHSVELRGPDGTIGTLMLDGRNIGTLGAGRTSRIYVASPDQQISVRTADGRYASIPQAAGSNAASTIATLLPVLAVSGTIVVEDPQHLLPALSLEGLEVELGPGLAAAVTSNTGTFAFPAAPLDSATRVTLAAETLPPNVEAAPAQIDANGHAVLYLRPKSTTQRTIF